MNITVNEYIDEKGESPYATWLDSLKDAKGKAAINFPRGLDAAG